MPARLPGITRSRWFLVGAKPNHLACCQRATKLWPARIPADRRGTPPPTAQRPRSPCGCPIAYGRRLASAKTTRRGRYRLINCKNAVAIAATNWDVWFLPVAAPPMQAIGVVVGEPAAATFRACNGLLRGSGIRVRQSACVAMPRGRDERLNAQLRDATDFQMVQGAGVRRTRGVFWLPSGASVLLRLATIRLACGQG
jgi:hypothetical protein